MNGNSTGIVVVVKCMEERLRGWLCPMSSHPTLSSAQAARTRIADFALLSFYTTLKMTTLQLLVERLYTKRGTSKKNLYFHISCMALGGVVLKICE